MKKISLIACGLLLGSTMAFGANNIDSAFKEGKVSGSLSIYGETTEYKGDASAGMGDPAYASGAISLAFETAEVKGFSAKAGFIGVHEFSEKHDGDADADLAAKSLMTEAYGKYANDAVAVIIGRQAIDLEWMGDYHEAAVVAISAVPNTTIVLGYSDKMAVAGVDEISDNFSGDWNGDGIKDDGAYVADIKYTGLKSVEVNPYAYSVPDIANWYGLKGTYTSDMFGAVAHYATSSEDVVNTNDGSIGHIELNTTFKDLTAAIGYVKTDKEGGAGSMSAVGDNISPFDSGNQVYSADAKTVYGSLGYTIADIELGALYGQTTYAQENYKEKELNLTVGYSFTEALGTSLLLANVNGDENDTTTGNATVDQNYALLTVEYTF